MDLDNILSKVRGLIAKAEHPDTLPQEAEACRSKADAMMLKYAIDQATLRDSQPAAEQIRPAKIKVSVCEAGSAYEEQFCTLVSVVCEHTRTKAVFHAAQADADLVRKWRDWYGKSLQVEASVYGFESDLKFFEILYTTLLLHMSNGIDPRPDASLSDEKNTYNLHLAGYNWLDIARMYYRLGHEYGWDGNKDTYMRFGSYWKRCYKREIRNRGEEFVHHPARFTAEARLEWRMNFAQSYVATVNNRLVRVRLGRDSGGSLVLMSAMDAINDMIAADFPDAKTMESAKRIKFNERAWQAGNRHAHTADLGGQSVAGKAAGAIE